MSRTIKLRTGQAIQLLPCASIGGSPDAVKTQYGVRTPQPLVGGDPFPACGGLLDDDAQFRDEIRPRCRAEPAADVGDVMLRRARRDEDRLADLGVGLALQHQPGDVELALAEDDPFGGGGVPAAAARRRCASACAWLSLGCSSRAHDEQARRRPCDPSTGSRRGRPAARRPSPVRPKPRPCAAASTASASTDPASVAVHTRPACAMTAATGLCGAAATSARAWGLRSSGRLSRIPCWMPVQRRCAAQTAGEPSCCHDLERPARSAAAASPVSPTRAAEVSSSASGWRMYRSTSV